MHKKEAVKSIWQDRKSSDVFVIHSSHTYNEQADKGWGQKRLQAVFHQNSSPVHQGPELQVTVATVPEADKAKRQAGGRHFTQMTMPRPSQRHVDISAHTKRKF